jgi:AcrR family transcriptional regulator
MTSASRDIASRTNTGHLFRIVSHDRPQPPQLDARTERTYRALSVAMVDLLKTNEFDAITVQDLLDRAGVGRSTFYTHFRNKDDFLLADLERMLALLEVHFNKTVGSSRRLAPVAELFAHFAEVRDFADALSRSGRMDAVLDIASGLLARIIERRLRELGVVPRELPLSAAARVFGAMAMELAKWWTVRTNQYSAKDMDDRFHELVWRGLGEPPRTALE